MQTSEQGITRFRIVEKSLKQCEDGTVVAQCYWCKADVTLPLASIDLKRERFILRDPRS